MSPFWDAGSAMGYTRHTLADSALQRVVTAAFHAEQDADTLSNGLFITLDQSRRDCIGTLGNSNVRTPTLDLMAHDELLLCNGVLSG